MQKFGKRAALSLSQGGSEAKEFASRARVYCEEHGYILWNGDIHLEPDQEPHIVLDWVREVMSGLTIQTLLVPSIQHIHPTDTRYIANFLTEARKRDIAVISLNPTPTRLN